MAWGRGTLLALSAAAMVAGAASRAPAAADQQPAVGDHGPEVEVAASTVEVPVGAFNDLAVDPATGDVYLSGGEGVVSVSTAGQVVEALELGRAGHLAVEGDDLWVTLLDAGQVARIDLGAFAVAETFEVGDDLREPIVALDDGTVWFQAEGGLWRLDPATGQVGARGGPAGDLTEVPGRSDLVLVSTDDSHELLVHRVDVSGASASITASVPTGDGFGARELAASSDGERFSVAVRRGSQAVIEYGIDTMTATDAPSPVASPGALGVVRRGDVVAAVGSDLGVGMDGGPSTHLFSTFGSLARGVELSPDGRRAYTVSFDYPAYELDTWELQPRIETTTPAAVVADVPAAVGVHGGGLGGVSQATVAGVEVEILDGATTGWVPLWLPRGVDAGEQELQLHTPFGTASATLAVQENVGATLVGQVVVGGAGAEDRQVVITGGDLVSPRATTTAPDGEYRFDGLPQGTYDLSVRHRGADAAEQRLLGVELVPNRTRRIDVDLTPPAAEPGAEVARTRLGFQLPRELVHDAASQHTFVADYGGVVALDGSSGRVLARFVGIVNPSALTLGDGALFVLGDEDLSSGPQRIHRIDVDSLDVEASWPVGETARGPIAHAGDRVWFSDRDSHLTALDPATGEVEDHGYLGLLRPAPNSVDGGPDLLVVEDATTASPVDVYGVGGGSPVRLARSPHGSLGSNRELAASVEAGLVWASNGSSFSLEDASPTGSSHPTTRHSVDVTSAHGGMVLGGALVSNGGGGAPTHRIGHQPVERGAELTPDGGAAHLLADIEGPGFDGSAAIWDLAPHIRSIEAPVPDGGGIVVLVGDGLGATSAVEIDGASAPATVLDESRVEAVVPASEVGAEHIATVTTPWGTSAPFVFETGSMPPEPVRHVVATPDVERIVVTWTAPSNLGSAALDHYEVDLVGGEERHVSGDEPLRVTLAGQEAGIPRQVRVRAVTAAGPGPWVEALPATPFSAPTTFADVPADHPFYEEIEEAAERGLVEGYPDGGFRPSVPVSRQAMAAFLHRLAGSPDAAGDPSFFDVPSAHPFAAAIAWLSEQGVVEGYPDGGFHPGAPVTRQAMAAFLHRLAGAPDHEPGPPAFSDLPADHPFFVEVEWLAAEGITGGYQDGGFHPGATVSRQAMAAFLVRFDDGPGVGL